MKFKLSITCALCAAALFFGGCNVTDGDGYQRLNDMLNAPYTSMTLTVTDSFGDDSLQCVYKVLYIGDVCRVQYSVERFNGIDAALQGAQTELKTTLSGEAIVMNGMVIPEEGDEVNLSADVVRPGLEFKEEYFANQKFGQNSFSADVTQAGSFFGADVQYRDMRVEANFEEEFSQIVITYTSEGGGSVQYKYVFDI